mgnify:CR=1 FL=1
MITLTSAQLQKMCELQEQINTLINPDWKSAGYNWRLATAAECIECANHIGWEWWKKPKSNIPEAQTEVVDMFHFQLGELIENKETEVLADGIILELPVFLQRDDGSNKISAAENVLLEIYDTFVTNYKILKAVLNLAETLGMTGNDIYERFCAKNTLNIFRQHNGYKDGTYKKHWSDGREDNEHMAEVLELYREHGQPLDFDNLYVDLESRYKLVDDSPEERSYYDV